MKETINDLLTKPLWQMTGEEFCILFKYANDQCSNKEVSRQRIYGIAALAKYLGCSESYVSQMKKDGVLKTAILSHVGKEYVFWGEEAQRCANEYKAHKAKEA